MLIKNKSNNSQHTANMLMVKMRISVGIFVYMAIYLQVGEITSQKQGQKIKQGRMELLMKNRFKKLVFNFPVI